MSIPKAELELHKRIERAVDVIFQFGLIDGSHHKQWAMDKILRILLDDNYDDVLKDFPDWDHGVAP